MIYILAIAMILFNFAFSEESKNIEKVSIPDNVLNALEIKTQTVKKRSIVLSKKYPAIVKDDLTLSQDVYSPVEGLVQKLLVKEGDKVKKGQKLALIYSPVIAQIQTQIYQAEVNLKTSKELFEREKFLYENRVIPYSRFFKAKINYENALAKLEALKRSLLIYGEIENGLVVLRSKLDGYIAKQDVVLGDSVGLNKRLFKIHSHDRLWVVAFVPVEEIGFFKKGNKIKVISVLGTSYGYVDFISHSVDEDTKRVQIRIIADNTKEYLKPNMFVDVSISKILPEKIYIPATSVVFNEGRTLVFKKEKNAFEPVEVKVGRRINGEYEILEGLKEGDEIVVSGTIHLKAKFFGEAEE